MAEFTLRELIELSKQNPDTDFAKSFVKDLQTGEFDDMAVQEDIDLQKVGRPSLQEMRFNMEQVDTEPQEKKKGSTVGEKVTNTAKDIGDFLGISKFGEGIGVTLANLFGSTKKIEEAGDRAVQNTTRFIEELERLKEQGVDTTKLEKRIQDDAELQRLIFEEGESILTNDLKNREVVGSALSTSALVLPGAVGSSLASKVSSGAATGYVFDVGGGLQNLEIETEEAFKPGIGTAIGGAFPILGKLASKAKKALFSNNPDKVLNSLIKPRKTDFAYGKNPGQAIADEGIVANTIDDLAEKVDDALKNNTKKATQIVQQFDDKTINITDDVINTFDNSLEKAAKQNNTAAFNRIQKMKEALTKQLERTVLEDGTETIAATGQRNLSSMKPSELVDYMTEVGKLTSYTGNPSDDKIANKVLQQVYGKLKGRLDDAVPDVTPVRKQISNLLSAKSAIANKAMLEARQNLSTFTGNLATTGGIVASIFMGNPVPALAGLGAAQLDKVIKTPAFKTRFARWLANRATKGQVVQAISTPELKDMTIELLRRAILSGATQNRDSDQ